MNKVVIVFCYVAPGNSIRVNQSMFSGALKVGSYASGKRVVSVKLPSVSSTKGSEAEDIDKPVGNSAQIEDALPTLVLQIPDLVTLSSYPKSQWQSLINLDVIKVLFCCLLFIFSLQTSFLNSLQLSDIFFLFFSTFCWLLTSTFCNFQERNKPIEPPKKPEKAPFFLPSVPSLSGEIMFKPTGSTNEAKGGEESSRIKGALAPSVFLQVLQSSAEMKNCKYVIF